MIMLQMKFFLPNFDNLAVLVSCYLSEAILFQIIAFVLIPLLQISTLLSVIK